MSESLDRRLRRLWLNLHLWLGVGLLVALTPLGLSGSVLVWHDAVDRALHGERYAVSGPGEAPMAVHVRAAQAAFAGRATLTQVRAPARAGDPVVAAARLPGPPGAGGRPRTLNAWIDPPTGRVLATAEPAAGLTMVLHRFHGSLLVPDVGRKIVGWLGWALFASCATGLWLWWPRFGGALAALRWRRGASQLFNLHHAVGFWICLPLAALALTGVFIAFPQTSLRLFDEIAPAPRPRLSAPPLAAPALTADQAVAAAVAGRPGARVAVLNWPQAGRRPSWKVELAGGGLVAVDDASGVARAASARSAGEARSPLAAWMRGVHDGGRGGLVWRWVITLAGAAPAVLGVTGLVMWLRRPKPGRRAPEPAR
jgi:uncharacterized iron-regulated membrane protein